MISQVIAVLSIVILAYWVYKNAVKRGYGIIAVILWTVALVLLALSRNPGLFFIGIISFSAAPYLKLFQRPRDTKTINAKQLCPKCGHESTDNISKCPKCNNSLKVQQ